MNLTEFGSAVRKARIDAQVTLQDMAKALGVTAAYLSGLEVGRKRISAEWVSKIQDYFRGKDVAVADLQVLADVTNKSIPLDGLAPQQSMMLAGFARVNLTQDQMKKFSDLLREVNQGD